MSKSKIVFYPVGNGDTTLIQLENDQNIMIDCYITAQSEDDKDESRYDIKNDILDRLPEREGKKYLDTFILTHPHDDHVSGFSDNFYCGEPSKYSSNEDKVFVDEIWFAPRILVDDAENISEKSQEIRDEISRRLDLHKNGDKDSDSAGNRIRMIGYTAQEDVSKLEAILTVAGDELNTVNGTDLDFLTIKVLGLTKLETDEEEDLNDTSVMLQFRFLKSDDICALAIFGGDAGSDNWERAFGIDPELTFDILLAPHHCSYKFFNENRGKDDPYDPTDEIVKFIENGQKNCVIVSSSKAIKDDGNNPPSYDAKKEYEKGIKDLSGTFYCLGEYPSEDKPKPLIIEISKQGPVIDDDHIEKSTRSRSSSAKIKEATTHKRTYGMKYE